jgi:GMP synthase (glutamine-hydrolysing)
MAVAGHPTRERVEPRYRLVRFPSAIPEAVICRVSFDGRAAYIKSDSQYHPIFRASLMAQPLRFLVAESEPPQARAERRESAGQSSGESYCDTQRSLAPGARCDRVKPADRGSALPDKAGLSDYDAIFLTGSPLHLYETTPEVLRQLEFMRAVFASATPAFGSCAGLQVATVAAGGSVRPNARGREAAFARRITPTEAGSGHPLLAGRPRVYDAPAIHGDEVEALPEGATILACNRVSQVQAAEIRHDGGVFWGVQYHPELGLDEIAAALDRQADSLIEAGLAENRTALDAHAGTIARLAREPDRRDLAWQLGLDEEVTDPQRRTTELRNFIAHAVQSRASSRCRA